MPIKPTEVLKIRLFDDFTDENLSNWEIVHHPAEDFHIEEGTILKASNPRGGSYLFVMRHKNAVCVRGIIEAKYKWYENDDIPILTRTNGNHGIAVWPGYKVSDTSYIRAVLVSGRRPIAPSDICPSPPNPLTWYIVKAYVNHKTFKAKWWKVGEKEPDWMGETTISWYMGYRYFGVAIWGDGVNMWMDYIKVEPVFVTPSRKLKPTRLIAPTR